ncbi:proclotting enzyme isoform X1 [Procambarus clarkii]|uniref:proclotting enzyme isoform X1 n=2 Tax=Procambarus clarkii TaxID=6728 RepID=UPI0037427302
MTEAGTMIRVRGSGVLLLLLLLSLHTSARRNIAPTAPPAERQLLTLLGGGLRHSLVLSTRTGNTGNECSLGDTGAAGTCTLLSECPAYHHLTSDLQRNLAFFRSRICRMTSENVLLCCPLASTRPPTVTNVGLRQPSFPPPSSGHSGVTGGRAPSTEHRPLGQPSRLPFQPTQSGFNPQPTQPSSNFPDRSVQSSFSPSLTTRPVLRPGGGTEGVLGVQGPTGDREPGALNTPDPTVLPEISFVIPPEAECGTRPNTSLTRNPGYWPWLVTLGRLQGEQFDPICSGALITSRHVLAAAHCLVDTRLATPTHVRLGSSHRARDLAIVNHVDAGYNNITSQNDIAIVTLSEVVIFNELVQPVCLPFRFEFDGFRYQNLDLVGMGPIITTGENRVQQLSQKNVNVAITGLDKCRRTFGAYKTGVFDHSKMCASGTSARDCMSDKGASVYFYDEDTTKKYFLVGLVSFAFGCTKPEEPGAYTRVGAHVQWLQQHMN